MKITLKLFVLSLLVAMISGCTTTNPYVDSWQGNVEERTVTIHIREDGLAVITVTDKLGKEIPNELKTATWSVDEKGTLVLYRSNDLFLSGFIYEGKLLMTEDGGSIKLERKNYAKQQPTYAQSFAKSEALDIAEATFRYQFDDNASGAQNNAKSYFLVVFGNDPSPGFLKRFKNHKPVVKKGSEYRSRKGLKFNISYIKRISKTKAEVSGGYYEGMMSASSNTYTLELKEGKWVVTRNEMHWIA